MTNKSLRSVSSFRQYITLLVLVSIVSATSAFAQTADKRYEVELVVTRGKKSVETDAVLIVGENTVRVEPDKSDFKDAAKEFAYTDIKAADYSFAKKPKLSTGGAVATAILLGVFVVPFLFMKKKNHWLGLQTEKDFAVIKLGNRNHRSIVADLKTNGLTVSELKEEGK